MRTPTEGVVALYNKRRKKTSHCALVFISSTKAATCRHTRHTNLVVVVI